MLTIEHIPKADEPFEKRAPTRPAFGPKHDRLLGRQSNTRRHSGRGADHHHESTLRIGRYALTYQSFYNYSARMDSELANLEEKIGQTVALCHRLRTENVDLRQQLAIAQSNGKKLTDKVEGARLRLETILQKIPG